MAVFTPFEGFRPRADLAARVACRPYDVLSSAEAREEARGNPHTFLHVDKSEIDLPEEIDLYDNRVYAKARENLDRFIAQGVLVQDDCDCFYIYRQHMDGRVQTGLVGCCSVDDYLQDVIRKHEHTRADKEKDRIRHVDECDANVGLVFLTYRGQARLDQVTEQWTTGHAPVYDFESGGVRHQWWVLDDPRLQAEIAAAFAKVKHLYVADGHHRSASAARVGEQRRAANPRHTGDEEYNRFLAVCFPSEQLHIMDYNRLIKDLGGRTSTQFLAELERAFTVEPAGERGQPFRPEERGQYGLYLEGRWYRLSARPEVVPADDPVGRLDVAVLQEHLLTRMLGITDPRTDKRLDFVGGIRGLGELERRVEEDGFACAVAMHPTAIDDLMAVADSGQVMPPKSTWFEPKLYSGLVVHRLG
ncbi:MAG: DUF1015 family protein [bacterium]|jgi:uncharacterized protein (DUF1015 family)|nr:DUF1015 family protein [bacterium]